MMGIMVTAIKTKTDFNFWPVVRCRLIVVAVGATVGGIPDLRLGDWRTTPVRQRRKIQNHRNDSLKAVTKVEGKHLAP